MQKVDKKTLVINNSKLPEKVEIGEQFMKNGRRVMREMEQQLNSDQLDEEKKQELKEGIEKMN